MRATTNMRRIRSGESFVAPDGKLVTCIGWVVKLADGRVKIPVLVEGSTRTSRRTFDGDLRVKLV